MDWFGWVSVTLLTLKKVRKAEKRPVGKNARTPACKKAGDLFKTARLFLCRKGGMDRGRSR